MEFVSMAAFGGLLCALGALNRKGNISSIHWYHRRKIREEDIPKYGKWMGNGTILIGVSLVAAALLHIILDSENVFYVVAGGTVVGIGIMIAAQIKYNKGLF